MYDLHREKERQRGERLSKWERGRERWRKGRSKQKGKANGRKSQMTLDVRSLLVCDCVRALTSTSHSRTC